VKALLRICFRTASASHPRPPGVPKQVLGAAIVLWMAAAAWGSPAPAGNAPAWNNGWTALSPWAQTTPHPAVVRVIAPGRDSMSLGSGSLVAVNQTHGLVITNWHVVCEATGQITVVFPDGLRSPAAVLRTDRDWDLAALAIWRPRVAPVALANQAPRLGESLTIAGYGSDSYRAVTGRCTEYVSPGSNLPFEMVELAAGARQGDSGGPIFNSRGELAGVLFGTARGRTTGSYCGRVRWFLTPLTHDFPQLSPGGTMLAQQPPTPRDPRVSVEGVTVPGQPPQLPYAAIATGQAPGVPAALPQAPPVVTQDTGWRMAPPVTEAAPRIAVAGPQPATAAGPIAAAPYPTTAPPATIATTTPTDPSSYRMDQIKSILAVVGVLAIFFHSLRLVSTLQG